LVEIDVVMITKNSAKPFLKKCLDSVYKNVPVRKLFVIDAFSTDETLEIVRRYPNSVVVQDPGNRAVARQLGIEKAETEWHLQVDSDVILSDNWFDEARKYIAEDVGAIWGLDMPINPHVYNRAKVMTFLRRMRLEDLMIRNAAMRGGMHDTLLRSNLVKQIKIPEDLHIFEDWYIKKWIEDRGYKWVSTSNPFCFHYNTPRFDGKFGYELAKLQKKYRTQSFAITFRNFLLATPKALAIFATSGDSIACSDQLKYYYFNFVGRLRVEFGR
jgi:glycosyltransferase involved in cell wall biosynthesis